MPHFVPEEKLATANSLSLVASYGTFPLGARDHRRARRRGRRGSAGSTRCHSLKDNTAVPALWFDAITYVVSAIIVFGLPIPQPARDGDQKFELTSTFSEIKDGLRFMRDRAFSRAVIVGLGGGRHRRRRDGAAQHGVRDRGARQQGASTACCSPRWAPAPRSAIFSRPRLPEAAAARHASSSWSVIGVGVFLVARRAVQRRRLAAVFIAGVGACAGARVRHRLHGDPGDVTDELRGRTFATLYAVVRLCLLLSLTVSPLFADLYDWLFSLVSGAPARHSSAASATASRACASRLWGGGGADDRLGPLRAPAGAAVSRTRTVATPSTIRVDVPSTGAGSPDPPGAERGPRDRALRRPRGRRRLRQEHPVRAARRRVLRGAGRRSSRPSSRVGHRSVASCDGCCSRAGPSTRVPRRC